LTRTCHGIFPFRERPIDGRDFLNRKKRVHSPGYSDQRASRTEPPCHGVSTFGVGRRWIPPASRPKRGEAVGYEFEAPFVLDGSKYLHAFGGVPTPHREAIRATLGWYADNLSPSDTLRRATAAAGAAAAQPIT